MLNFPHRMTLLGLAVCLCASVVFAAVDGVSADSPRQRYSLK